MTTQPTQPTLSEHLNDALTAITARDKETTQHALLLAALELGSGWNDNQHLIRAASCAVDIGMWSAAAIHTNTVLVNTSDDTGALPTAS